MRHRINLVQAIVLFALMIVGVMGLVAVGYTALIVMSFASVAPVLGGFVGAVVAMTAILWVIRRINRHDDPHRAKPPAEPP